MGGSRGKAEAKADVVDRCLVAKVRRGGRDAVLEHHSIVAEEIRIHECTQHTVIRVHAGEKESSHLQIPENALEGRVPESADTMFVDTDISRVHRECIDNRRTPAALFKETVRGPPTNSK
jgi:hypothetical protein